MDTLTPLLLASIKALLLLAAAGGAAAAMRRSPARLRAAMWAVALAGCLLIPVISPWLPALSVPMPERLASLARASSPPAAQAAVAPVGRIGEPRIAFTPAPSLPVAAPAPDPGLAIPLSAVLAAVWATGAGLLLARLGLGLWRVSRLIRRAEPVTDRGWARMLERTCALADCRRRIRLLASDEVQVPATVGFLRPTIVLPKRAASWLDDRRRAVLLHEVIHVARLDWPPRLIARLARAVYWFNPVAWWAVRRLDLEQELACDEEVLSFGTGASDYACHLLGVARHALPCPQPAIPALGMARRTHLEERIMTILKRSSHRRVGLAVLLPAVVLVAAMVPALAAVAPADPQPASTELKEIVAELKAAEEQFKPQLEELEKIEVDMEPQLEALEELEIEIDTEKIAEIESQMEPYLARIRDIEIDMKPLQEQLEALEEKMQGMEFHIEDGTLDEIHFQIQEQMSQHMAGLEELHIDMEPYLEELESVHAEMAHLHQQMEAVHIDMEPVRAQIEDIHINMEPFHEQMEAIQRQMEPFHAEMERLGERLDEAIREEVANYLRSQLAAVTSAGAPFDEAAEKIVADARVHIDDGTLEVDASRREVREILKDLFEPARTGGEHELQAAIEAAAEGLSPLMIQVD